MAFSIMNLFQYTEAKCAKEVIKTIKKLSPNSNPIYDPARSSVNEKDNEDGSYIFLGNIYNHIKTMPKAERLKYLENFLGTSLGNKEISYELSANQLIPRLKSKSEIANRYLSIQAIDKNSSSWSTYEFTNSFVWELGIDSTSAVTIVSEETLEKLSLSKEEAMAIAKKNLFTRSDNNTFIEIQDGLFMSRYDDDHDATRILMTDLVSGLKVKGKPVAFVPAAKVLLICGSEDFNIFKNIESYLTKSSEGCRPLSRQPLILNNGEWQDFIPEKKEQYAGVINQIMIEEYSSCEEQKELLNQINTSKNLDIFVASYQVYEKKESPFYHSTTTWSEDVHAWIPRAETISFVSMENGEAKFIGQANFDEIINNFSDLIKPLGYVPERYEVRNFPEKEKLKNYLSKI